MDAVGLANGFSAIDLDVPQLDATSSRALEQEDKGVTDESDEGGLEGVNSGSGTAGAKKKKKKKPKKKVNCPVKSIVEVS